MNSQTTCKFQLPWFSYLHIKITATCFVYLIELSSESKGVQKKVFMKWFWGFYDVCLRAFFWVTSFCLSGKAFWLGCHRYILTFVFHSVSSIICCYWFICKDGHQHFHHLLQIFYLIPFLDSFLLGLVEPVPTSHRLWSGFCSSHSSQEGYMRRSGKACAAQG